MPRKPTTPNTVDRLITDAFAIEAEAAKKAGTLGFMARAFLQATLPHRKVQGNEFVRHNGNFTLSILTPSESGGIPYGTVPRLLLAWLTTEAIKTKSRELTLGDNLSGFMAELGLVPTGGRWGSITRLKDQSVRLFSSSITALYQKDKGLAMQGFRVADKTTLWWDPARPSQHSLWKSEVKLSETFFNEILDRPVPIDLRALKALKRSPLAIDLFTWLTYRMSYLERPVEIPWAALANQFGSDYRLLRQFKAALLDELKKVVIVYPKANVGEGEKGLLLKPSPTIIGRGLERSDE